VGRTARIIDLCTMMLWMRGMIEEAMVGRLVNRNGQEKLGEGLRGGSWGLVLVWGYKGVQKYSRGV
jgi:hypothetical protein